MFDVSSKNSSLVVYGLDINVARPPGGGGALRVLVRTREGTHAGFEYDESSWTVWVDATVAPGEIDGPTPVPQGGLDRRGAIEFGRHLAMPPRSRRAFYVSVVDGPYLRHRHSGAGVGDAGDEGDKLHYQDAHLSVGGSSGHAKRAGWDGGTLDRRTFSGGVHYYLGDGPADLGAGSALLPGVGLVTPGPTGGPTGRPTAPPTDGPTAGPTLSSIPTGSPSESPTTSPSTGRPTASPVDYEYLSSALEADADDDGGPVLVSAGHMFDVKARGDVEISSIGFNTYLTTIMNVTLYVREDGGSYVGHEDTMEGWTLRTNVEVMGMGMGNPTYIPRGSFEPLYLPKQGMLGMYVTTDGPYIRASPTDNEAGTPHVANADLVLYAGVGKRYPMAESGSTLGPRVFNGVFRYEVLDVPTMAPTIDVSDLWVTNATFLPVADAYVDRGDPDGTFGRETRLDVDGGAGTKVALVQFDLGLLNGQTGDVPSQVLKATLRLYSAESKAMFGGYVSVVPNGEIDEKTASWNTVPYGGGGGDEEVGGGTTMEQHVGRFRSVWPRKYYDIDLTMAFRGANTIPRGILVLISSDQEDGVSYRSRDNDGDDDGSGGGTHPNGPRLTVDFAYDPNTNKAMARDFGSDPPTPAPTVFPRWEDAILPDDESTITGRYFNYNPGTFFGPDNWMHVEGDEWYDNVRGLDVDTRRNRCSDGTRQSPRDLCLTNDECIEWHEPRPRVSSIARCNVCLHVFIVSVRKDINDFG